MKQYIAIPYINFKDRLRKTKELRKRHFYVEDMGGYLYGYRNTNYLRKKGIIIEDDAL